MLVLSDRPGVATSVNNILYTEDLVTYYKSNFLEGDIVLIHSNPSFCFDWYFGWWFLGFLKKWEFTKRIMKSFEFDKNWWEL